METGEKIRFVRHVSDNGHCPNQRPCTFFTLCPDYVLMRTNVHNSRVSPVSLVTRLRTGQPGLYSRSVTDISLRDCIWLWCPTALLSSGHRGLSSQGTKEPKHGADPPVQSSAEVENEWSHTSSWRMLNRAHGCIFHLVPFIMHINLWSRSKRVDATKRRVKPERGLRNSAAWTNSVLITVTAPVLVSEATPLGPLRW
jgi:hypothetical protein